MSFFFGLFSTREDRRSQQQMKLRQGKHRIQRYLQTLEKASRDYAVLAKKARRLDDQEQFRHLASGYLKTRDTISRWERYLLRLNTLEMRKQEVEATREFLQSMNAVTSAILDGARPKDVTEMHHDMERAILQSAELEDVLAQVMDATADQMDNSQGLDLELLEQIAATSMPDASGDEKIWRFEDSGAATTASGR